MNVEPPFVVSYSVTTRCNLRCKHCYSESTQSASSDELSTQEAFGLIDELAQWRIRLLIFDGGEPLCREDFFDLARYASDKGIRAVMGSNATLIDRGMARELAGAGIQSVAISIDGATPETHDSFRGKTGAFQEAIAGAEACKEAGLPFQFNMVVRKRTLAEVPEMLRLAVDKGANAAEVFDLVLAGRAKRECRDEALEVEERQQLMEYLADAQRDCPIVIRVCACPMYPLVLKGKAIRPKHFPARLLTRIPYYDRGCAAGMPRGYAVVRANGEVNPCMLLQANLGNVRERSIREMWDESPLLGRLRSRDLLKGECGACLHKISCGGCRGRAYEESGDVLAPDPACWLVRRPADQEPNKSLFRPT